MTKKTLEGRVSALEEEIKWLNERLDTQAITIIEKVLKPLGEVAKAHNNAVTSIEALGALDTGMLRSLRVAVPKEDSR